MSTPAKLAKTGRMVSSGCEQARLSQAGFSVLEALVAVLLLAIVMLPLLTTQGQVTRTAAALERSQTAYLYERSALEFLSSNNPTLRPRGTEPLGDAVLEFSARAFNEDGRSSKEVRSGRFLVQLYLVDYTIRLNGRDLVSDQLYVTGWREAISFEDAL